MSSDGLKYLIVRDKVGRKVRGFMSFMVDTEYGVPCVWMYEIHLDEELRGYVALSPVLLADYLPDRKTFF